MSNDRDDKNEKFAADTAMHAMFIMMGADGFEELRKTKSSGMTEQMTNAVMTYAPLLAKIDNAVCALNPVRDQKDVAYLDYLPEAVSRPFGQWLYGWLKHRGNLPPNIEALVNIQRSVEQFFMRGVDRSEQEAVREVISDLIDQADTDPMHYVLEGRKCTVIRTQQYAQLAPNAWGPAYGWELRDDRGELLISGFQPATETGEAVMVRFPTKRSLGEHLAELEHRLEHGLEPSLFADTLPAGPA